MIIEYDGRYGNRRERGSMIYFTSDLHLGHCAVLSMQEGRLFENVEEMNEAFIESFNKVVQNNDTVYILGDLCYRIPVEEANALIKRLHGKKYLIRGNHDRKYDESLFEEVSDYKEISYNKKRFILMHYPLLSWKTMRFGSYMLHGHIHSEGIYNQNNRDQGLRRYDVGVDANNYRPISIEEIISYFEGYELFHFDEQDIEETGF